MAGGGGGRQAAELVAGWNPAPLHPAWTPVHVPTCPALSLWASRAPRRQHAGSVSCPACPRERCGPTEGPRHGGLERPVPLPTDLTSASLVLVSDPGSQMRVLGPQAQREEPGRTLPAVLSCLPPPSSSLEA